MVLVDLYLEQYLWESLPFYHFSPNTTPSLSQLHLFTLCFVIVILREVCMEMKKIDVAVIDDWYSRICLDTQLIVFIDCLKNIRKSFPLHDITLCQIQALQALHTPIDHINSLFVWKLINKLFMDGLHVSCSKL
jgi:hypothetical protein